MDVITSPKSLRYIDRQLANFQESNQSLRQDRVSSLAEGDGYVLPSGARSPCWIDRDTLEYIIPPIKGLAGSGLHICSQQDSLDRSLKLRQGSISSSECSAASSLTTLSESAYRVHERTQFAKLLPRSNANESPLQDVGKANVFSSLRETLGRKLPVSRLNGDTIFVCADEEGRSPSEESRRENRPEGQSSPTTRAPSMENVNQDQRNGHVGDLEEACSRKRDVPQGCDLAEAQLALQENILSNIADQAVKKGHKGSGDTKVTSRHDSLVSEEEPEDVDRELEVTLELMKQLRKSLGDGFYQDMYLADDKGQEESTNGKYAIVCDVLLMLRCAFLGLLANFERTYRPTGFVVADQEMVKVMDEQLLARKNFLRRYPSMTMKDMLNR